MKKKMNRMEAQANLPCKAFTISALLLATALLFTACASSQVETEIAPIVEEALEQEQVPAAGSPQSDALVYPSAEFVVNRTFSQSITDFYIVDAPVEDVVAFYADNIEISGSIGEYGSQYYLETPLMAIMKKGGDETELQAELIRSGRLVNIWFGESAEDISGVIGEQRLSLFPEDATAFALTFYTQ